YWQYGRPTREADLTRDEQDYLRSAYRWSWFQLLSPAYLGMSRLHMDDGYWNFAGAFFMTSFGTAVDVNGFFPWKGVNVALTLHTYHNAGLHLPGLEARIMRYPATIFGRTIFLALTVSAWIQPHDQLFWTMKKEGGGLIGGGLSVPFENVEWFVEMDAKSP